MNKIHGLTAPLFSPLWVFITNSLGYFVDEKHPQRLGIAGSEAAKSVGFIYEQ